MRLAMNLERITGREVLDRHLCALVRADPRLARALASAGEVPLRLRAGGFAGMAQIVCAQLLSVASAAAIHARFEKVLGQTRAETLLRADAARLRAAGLSFSKIATLRALAEAEVSGRLDYASLAEIGADAALDTLMKIRGIGRWSAEVYLLFSTGHPDIFPAGDLALRKAVGHVQGRDAPDEKEVRAIAADWSPWRGAAARLMWRHYAVVKSREGVV